MKQHLAGLIGTTLVLLLAGRVQAAPPPRYAGTLELASLKAVELWQDPGDPIGCSADRKELTIAFARGFVTLGQHLELTTASVKDMAAAPEIPPGFIPSHVFRTAAASTVLFSIDDGRLLYSRPFLPGFDEYTTEAADAVAACRAPDGSIALLKGRRILIYIRKADPTYGLQKRELLLPSGFYTALAADRRSRFWIYEFTTRQILIVRPSGEEVARIQVQFPDGAPPFPQVFQTLPDGGFLMGAAGLLWKGDGRGRLQWQIDELPGRESLPAFFQIAIGEESFFLLDPPAGRVHLFLDQARFARSPAVQTYTRLLDHERQGEAARLLNFSLNRGLLLLAFQHTNRHTIQHTRDRTRIITLLQQKTAFLLARLAEELEMNLSLTEAERIYGLSIAGYRSLRLQDPVDPDYSGQIRDLVTRRKRLRDLNLAEQVLSAQLQIQESRLLILLNSSASSSLERLEIVSAFMGIPASRNSLFIDRLEARGALPLRLPRSLAALGIDTREDMQSKLSLLVSYTLAGKKRRQMFRFPVTLPGMP